MQKPETSCIESSWRSPSLASVATMIHYSISPAFLGTHGSSLFLHSSARWRCYGFVSWRRTALENTAADHRFYFTFSYSLLQRDAVHKRGLCRSAVAGWLTGCPSRLCIVSKRVIKFSNFFHRLVSPVFQYQTLWQYSDGTLSDAGWV